MVPVPQQISASYQKLNRRRNCFPIHNSSLQEQAEGNSNSRFLNFRNRPGSYFMTKIIFPWDLSCTAAVSVLHANCTLACRGCSSLSSALPIWPLLHRSRRQDLVARSLMWFWQLWSQAIWTALYLAWAYVHLFSLEQRSKNCSFSSSSWHLYPEHFFSNEDW